MRKLLSSFLLSASFAVAAIASPVKSNLGGDGVENCAAPESTARLYIQDGLIAMWDGIENVGYGMHSGSMPFWVDLVGGCITEPTSLWASEIGPDYISVTREHITILSRAALGFSNATWQVEVAFTSKKTNDNNILLTFDTGAYFGIQGGNRYARVGDGAGRLGWCCSNLKRWVYSNAEIPYSEPVSGTMSMRHDSKTKSNNRFYWDSVYQGNFHYANETNLSGWFYMYVPQFDRPTNVETHYHCIRLYNRVLTDAEITYNYSIDKMRFGL